MDNLNSLQVKIVLRAGLGLLLLEASTLAYVAITAPSALPGVVGIGVVLSTVALALLWSQSRQVTQSISELTDAVKALAQGKREDEETLARERYRYRTLIDNLPEALCVKDAEGRWLVVNAAMAQSLDGKAPEDLVGKSPLDLFPKELALKVIADDKAVMRSGQPSKCEETTTDAAGNKKCLVTTKTPFRDSEGKVAGLVGSTSEVTERKQAEEVLAKERNLMRTLIDAIPDRIWSKDTEGHYTLCNPPLLRLFGVKSADEVLGKKNTAFYPPDLAAMYTAQEQALFQSGQSIINKVQPVADAAGNRLWDSTTKVLLRDSEGKVIGFVGIARDITKEKLAEEALVKEQEALKETVAQMQQGASKLAAAATQILSASTQTASTTREEASAVNQITSTVTEIKVSAEQVAQRAQGVAEGASKTGQVAQKGKEAVSAAIGGMQDIQQKVEAIAENILALSEKTQQIGDIIDTVSDIAGQSNILALNAAIEAAQAGEAGKGFRVVADEVRSLAEQSRQAASQVKVILGDIQKATNLTVMATEQGTKGVQAGSEQVHRTAQTIQELAQVVEESARAAQQIVAGVEQQTIGLDQIVIGMNDINQAAQQSAAGAQQSQKAAQDLNTLAEELKQTVARYRM